MNTLPDEIWALIAADVPRVLITCHRGANIAAAYCDIILAGWGITIERTASAHRITKHLPAMVVDYLPQMTGNFIEIWTKDGEIHRTRGPAITVGAATMWMNRGKIHRTDDPAFVNGKDMIWAEDGQIHRCGGPAIMLSNDSMSWYERGLLHNKDGPAVVYPNGDAAWYERGQMHRYRGPAVICSDGKLWYNYGRLIRTKGLRNNLVKGYWVNGGEQYVEPVLAFNNIIIHLRRTYNAGFNY
jgi:hypothetical protein